MGRKRENKINKQSARWMGCKFVRGVWPVRINGLAADGFFYFLLYFFSLFYFQIQNFKFSPPTKINRMDAKYNLYI
jgi:hypothetical protein